MIKEHGVFPLDYQRSLTPKEKKEELVKLTSLGEKVVEEFFPSMINRTPVFEINNRLSSTYGQFIYGKTDNGVVQISGRLIKVVRALQREEILIKVLKHELAHWFLWITGKPFSDGDEGFEKLLLEIGSVSSGATNDKFRLAPKVDLLSFKVVGECEKCGHKSYFNNRSKVGYVHTKNNGKEVCGDIKESYITVLEN